MLDDFFYFGSDWGHIGPLCWINSCTSGCENPWRWGVIERWWGAIVWNPHPMIDYRQDIERVF